MENSSVGGQNALGEMSPRGRNYRISDVVEHSEEIETSQGKIGTELMEIKWKTKLLNNYSYGL